MRWILAKTARKIEVGKSIINQATGKASVDAFAKPIWSTTGNAKFALYSHYFGYGAADASAAVKLAKDVNYRELPSMEECTVAVTANVASMAAAGCPSNIEFHTS